MMTTPKQRPTGITILAILEAIGGIFAILGGLTLMGIGAIGGFAGSGLLASMGVFGGLVLVALGLVGLYVAWGAWNLQPWAWMWLVIVAIVTIVIDIFDWRRNLFAIIINAVIIYYLYRAEVKAAFGRA
ncbi:MAG TPA: hypothetical protein VGK88_00515 [bacterium]|jgi:hypothetical protein